MAMQKERNDMVRWEGEAVAERRTLCPAFKLLELELGATVSTPAVLG